MKKNLFFFIFFCFSMTPFLHSNSSTKTAIKQNSDEIDAINSFDSTTFRNITLSQSTLILGDGTEENEVRLCVLPAAVLQISFSCLTIDDA